MTDVSVPERRLSTWLRRIRLVHIVPVLSLIALSAWAFASPVGASPDDDYHLASIWCANDARTALCAPDPVNGDGWRLVPPGLMTAPCFVADMDESAACQRWPHDTTPSVAADHGNWIGAYPPLYYAAMNVLASTDIQASALLMRFANIALFVALSTALALLVPRDLRVPLIAGWAMTIVPLGGFLIASNNPGAWALAGVGCSWIAALAWFRASGARAVALGGLTVLSVLIAAGARTDAAVYSIIGLGIASVLSFERSRVYGLRLLLPVALAVVAVMFFRTSGYAAVAEGGLNGGILDSDVRDPLGVLGFNVISIPELWTGVFGSWGLGWKMETWPGFALVEFAALVVFIGLASLGIRSMEPRKAAMSLALVATLYLLPIYVLTRGMSVVGENVQPRYLLPLVVVLAGLLLYTHRDLPLQPGPWHVIPAVVLLAGANCVALYINLQRYITGLDFQRFALERDVEWWWPGTSIGPTAVWIGGTLAFAATVAVLGAEWLRGRSRIVISA